MTNFEFSPATTRQEQLDHRLHEFMHTHRNTLCRYFQQLGMFSGHPRVLFLLRHNPGMTQKDLAKTLGVAAPTLSVSIRRMESAGLVERKNDTTDLRVQRLYLTPLGIEVDSRCAKGRDFLIEALFADFSEQDMQQLERLLIRMTANLNKAADTLPPCDDNKEGTL